MFLWAKPLVHGGGCQEIDHAHITNERHNTQLDCQWCSLVLTTFLFALSQLVKMRLALHCHMFERDLLLLVGCVHLLVMCRAEHFLGVVVDTGQSVRYGGCRTARSMKGRLASFG